MPRRVEYFDDPIALRAKALLVAVTAVVTNDQGELLLQNGVDLEAARDGEKVVIQCKRYRNTAAGEPAIRDLYDALHDENASRAYLITTGYSMHCHPCVATRSYSVGPWHRWRTAHPSTTSRPSSPLIG